jgi:Tfp pilus assembly protein PilO
MTKTTVIPVLLAVVLTAVVYVVSEQPARARISALTAELAAEETKVDAFRQELIRLQPLIARRNAEAATVARQLPGSEAFDRVSALYNVLDSLGRRDGLRVEEITPSIEETVRYFTEAGAGNRIVPIQITVRGAYRSLAGLTAAVEKNPYWDHLLSLQVMGGPELSPDCRLVLSFAADVNQRVEVAVHE